MHTSSDPPGQSEFSVVVFWVVLDFVDQEGVVLVINGDVVGEDDPPIAEASIPNVEKWILNFHLFDICLSEK